MKVTVCDKCKRHGEKARTLWIPTGKFEPDPAGGSSEEVYETIDLCLDCAALRLEKR